ncbi:cupin domain-containing protein [Rhodosalinus sp.]|uniref:cupin domain-containing protein n=1 Tax=Rhodosalinus sp. TaxID=2047741 RepID=UPI00356283A5
MDSAVACPSHFSGLLDGGWQGMDFRPFRPGIDICRLREADPGVALLRYAPGAAVPRHEHTGLETILVLDGVQSDERGDYTAGTLILNPEGSTHSVWSESGCVVLIQWERPVRFLDEETTT